MGAAKIPLDEGLSAMEASEIENIKRFGRLSRVALPAGSHTHPLVKVETSFPQKLARALQMDAERQALQLKEGVQVEQRRIDDRTAARWLSKLVDECLELERSSIGWMTHCHDAYVDAVQGWVGSARRFLNAYYGRDALETSEFEALDFVRSKHFDYSSELDAAGKLLKKYQGELSMKVVIDDFKYDVFLSYAHADKKLVNAIHKELDKFDLSVWQDVSQIEWGDDWKKKIEEGLRCCRLGIVLISRESIGREWTNRELIELVNRQRASSAKIVLPLLYRFSAEEMAKQYPELASIQAMTISKVADAKKIAVLFVKQLIKSLKQTDGN